MAEETGKSPFVLRLEEEMRRKGIEDRAALSRAVKIPYHRLNPWWVRPKAKANAADLLALAKFFDVDEEFLLRGGERKPFQRMAALLRRAEALDEAMQAELESYLTYLEIRASHRSDEQERQ